MENAMENVDHEMLGSIKRHSGIGIAVGVIAVIAGVLALFAPFATGLSIAIMVGALLVASGLSRLYLAFKMGSFGHGLLVFFVGLVSIVAGGYMLARPGIGLATLTIFLASYFLVSGIFEIIWAFRLRPIDGWGWALFSGIAALILGVMIWRQFPVSGTWAVGILVGIQLIFTGTAIASICNAARKGTKKIQAAI